MSHLFGLNPPVFSRPVTAVPVSSSATLEEDIVRQVDEANAAVQAARLAEQEEDKQRIELQQLRSNLNWKIYSVLQEFKKLVDESIVQEVRHHQDLALSKQYLQQHQFEYLTERRETLTKYDQDLSDSILRMQNYISQVQEEEQKHKDSESTNTVNPDTLAIPADLHSKKLLFLTAQNVALSDAFYYLDKTLEAGAITLDRHLRTVRQLARRQFYIRAHLSKVKQDGN
jgi:ESCRT-I complex subunit TSG101